MTLVRRANSKHWYVQFQLKHQTVIRSTRTTDKRTAERVAAKIRAEAHERIVLGKKKQITLGDALQRFIQTKAGTPIRKAFRRAGLHDCTIHTLRHTHASRLIQNGLSVYEVRAVLGHTDIKTTMRYAHLEQASVTQKARDVINRLNNP